MRVAIYARVSTDAQEQRGTIGSQIEALRERVAAEDATLIGEFIDDGVSGARLDRPGLDTLRDTAEAGLIDAVWCLTPDRLSRSYAYQVLITDELARHGVTVRYLDAPDIASDPQARLLTQIQSVIAEYERAKISERSRRGKLFRAKAGEATHWRAPYGYTRIPRRGDQPAHLVINEAHAAVVRRIFADYTTAGLSLRKIRDALNTQGVPTINGARAWETGTIGRILRREAYVGRAQVNRTKMIADRGPTARPRQVARAKDEWITIPCPPIIDEATFAAAARTCAHNTNFSTRRLDPNEEGWLLRGLVFCACGTRSIVDRGRSTKPGGIRYYACRNRMGIAGVERSCHEGNVRAEALDDFVFEQVKQALLSPQLLLAGNQTIGSRQPKPDDELLTAELARLDRRIDATKTERRRIADLYQTGVIDAHELARRAEEIDRRHRQLTGQRDQLIAQRHQLANSNTLNHRIHNFANQVSRTIDQLDFHQRQRLMRILIEEIHVHGWKIDIHLRIPLDEPPNDHTDQPPQPPHSPPTNNKPPPLARRNKSTRPTNLSTEDRLRNLGHGASPAVRDQRAAVVAAAGHDLGGDVADEAGAVEHSQPGRGHLTDGDHPVGEPAAIIEIDMGVEEDAIPGLIGPRSGPTRPLQGRPADHALGDQVGADAVGQGFAVGVGDGQDGHPVRPVHLQISQHGPGHGVQRLGAVGVVVFPAGPVAELLAGSDIPGPETAERVLFDGVGLAAIHRQLGRRHPSLSGLFGQAYCQPAGADRLGLEGIAHHPDLSARAGHGRGQHRLGVPVGQLGELVHDHHTTGR